MSIQSNINQTLSIAGLFARMSPGLQKGLERRNLEEQATQVTKAREVAQDTTMREEYQDQLADINKKLFELDPSEQTLQTYSDVAYKHGEPTILPDDPEAIATEQLEAESRAAEVEAIKRERSPTAIAEQSAQEALKTEQTRTRNTRRNFLDYIKDEPTSLGSTFGELDPGLQKKIAKAGYSKSERKKIMDRKDAENNG